MLTSPGLYGDWLATLMANGEVTRQGNISLAALPVDGPACCCCCVLVAAVAGWTIVRDERAGFVAALIAGLLLAPYTLLYAASILVLAVRPALGFAPRATRILALVANLVLIVAPVALLAVALAVTAWRPNASSRPVQG